LRLSCRWRAGASRRRRLVAAEGSHTIIIRCGWQHDAGMQLCPASRHVLRSALFSASSGEVPPSRRRPPPKMGPELAARFFRPSRHHRYHASCPPSRRHVCHIRPVRYNGMVHYDVTHATTSNAWACSPPASRTCLRGDACIGRSPRVCTLCFGGSCRACVRGCYYGAYGYVADDMSSFVCCAHCARIRLVRARICIYA